MKSSKRKTKAQVNADYASMLTHWSSANEYLEYLKTTLIPDLRKSGSFATAEDFQTAVNIIQSVIK